MLFFCVGECNGIIVCHIVMQLIYFLWFLMLEVHAFPQEVMFMYFVTAKYQSFGIVCVLLSIIFGM